MTFVNRWAECFVIACSLAAQPALAEDSLDTAVVDAALLLGKSIAVRADRSAGKTTYFAGMDASRRLVWFAAGDGHCVAHDEQLPSAHLSLHVHPWSTERLPGSGDFAACRTDSEVHLVVEPDGTRAWQTEVRSGERVYREVTRDHVGEWTPFNADP